jgi:hypothetical protein
MVTVSVTPTDSVLASPELGSEPDSVGVEVDALTGSGLTGSGRTVEVVSSEDTTSSGEDVCGEERPPSSAEQPATIATTKATIVKRISVYLSACPLFKDLR